MSGKGKINLSDSLEDIRNFFSGLVSRESKLRIASESELNGKEVTFINYKSEKNLVILSIPEEKILVRFTLDDESTFMGIKSLEITYTPEITSMDESSSSSEVTQVKPIIEQPIQAQETEEQLVVDIIVDDIQEQEITILQEATVWELSYKSSTLIEDINNQLQTYYNKKNKDIDIDTLYRESHVILDLINKFRSSNDVTDKSTKKHTPEFKPLLENIISNQFLPSYISPIVFDQKKFYTKNEMYLDEDSKKELDLKNDIIFVNEEEELQILNEINTQYRNKKNTMPEFKDLKKILEKLYEGGQIELPTEEGEKTTVSFEPINRSHINNIPDEDNNVTFYKTELKNNTSVVRNCFSNGGCTVNPDNEDEEVQLNVTVSTRLADGEILVIRDTYDDRFIYETKGEVKSCNSAGDKFYSGVDKTTDLHKTISKPPQHLKYVEGENVNIVGFYIKAMNFYKPNVINGNQIIENDGHTKKYPKLFNEGLTINDACNIKSSKLLKIIDNHEEFNWDLYNPNYNYVILFKTHTGRHQLQEDEYLQIVSHIIPTVDEVMKIESDKINNCMNLSELYNVLNKHNINPRQISTEILLKYNIFGKFISNGNAMKKYEEYLKNRIVLTKNKSKQFMKLDNILIQFKNNVEKTMRIRGHYIQDEQFATILRESMKSMCEPIFRLYNGAFLKDFVNDYLDIKTEVSEREYLTNLIIDKTIILSDSIYAISDFTKYFTNPEELISPEYQGLFNKYLIEYNIPINPFTETHINHFDKNILKHLDFISNMKANGNNSQEIIEIINLNNLKKLNDSISKTMNEYGRIEYNNTKTQTDPSWEDLSQSERINFIPNYEMAAELRNRVRQIKDSYLEQKTIMNDYVKKCKNIRIMKEYVSLEDLIYDNNKITYTNDKYDTTKNDLTLATNLRSSIEAAKFEEEFEKMMFSTYIYESDENVRAKISTVLSILSDPSLKKARKIKSGDYAIINDGKRRLLYLRRGQSWIPINKSHGKIETCYNYDELFLGLEFNDIKQFCIDYKADNHKDCIKSPDNDIIVNKLYKLIFLHDNIQGKINNIVKSLEYQKTIDEKIVNLEGDLKKGLKVIKSMNRKKENKLQIVQKPIQKVKKVYPPKNILNRLDGIKRLEDFDQRNILLKNFISEYGVQWKTVDGEILGGDQWWYNIPKVNVPLICTHNNLLMDSALKDTKTKEDNMRKVRDEFGVLDGEYYYCKVCGEVIDFQKYSEFEGFGRDDKVINVREVMDEEDEDYEDIDTMASIPVSSARRIINLILRKINVDLTVNDYKEVIEIVTNRIEKMNNELTNLKSFYYNFIKGVGRNAQQQQKENELLSRFESLAGADYTVDFFRNINSKTKDSKLLKFVALFYDITTNKPGKYIKLQKGLQVLTILAYSISALAEVIRTSIPDYTIKGSGVEKSQKKGKQASGIIINDIFDSKITQDGVSKLWITSYLIDNIFDDISKSSNNDLRAVNNFLSQMIKISVEQIDKRQYYTQFVEEKYKEVSDMGNMKERVEDKEKYQLETYVKSETKVKYDWDEFLPSLEFNNTYTYTSPNISSIISSQKSNIEQLKELNVTYTTSPNESLKSQIQTKTFEIQNKNQELRNIESKMGFNLITKINNIITRESLPDNFNPSAYTNSSNYDIIKGNYLDDFIKIDYSIQEVKDDLDKIREYFTKYNYDSSIIYDIIITTLEVRDLQSFMKLDRTLYQNNDDLVKTALINKIKQNHYMYNLNEGINYGQLRYFKELNDSDYYIVTELMQEEIQDELFESTLKERLLAKYGETYPNIEFKLRILNEFNGKAEVDVMSMEFKTDISENIDSLTMDKSIPEINEIIAKIELNANDIQLNTEKSFIHISNEINNKDILDEKLREMLSSYASTCSDEQVIGDTVNQLMEIQKKLFINSPQNDDSQLYRTSKTDIIEKLSPFFTYCKEDMSNKIRLISEIAGGNSNDILSHITDVNDYYNELIESIDARLKIEDITNPEIKIYEKSFRENGFKTSRFSNRVNAQISIIRYIINCLSCFHYRLSNNKSEKEFSTLFLQEDDKKNMEKITENASYINKTITRIIGDIQTRGNDKDFFLMPVEQFQKINILLEKLTMYNNSLDNKGMINTVFVNNPEIMIGFTNNIIVYLINLLVSEVDEDHNNIMRPLINNIILYIKNASFTNDITDKNIKTILDKHRADENQARLKRFNKKDDEEKSLHNIYRKYNLGKQIVEDEITINDAEVGFLSVETDEHTPIMQDNDGLDDFDAEEDLINSMEIDNIALADNILEEDIEDREEYE
tara:strand:+ start:11698 stop:18540 length:6843 start_codon:yes stop_codon:yes gene_type:complete